MTHQNFEVRYSPQNRLPHRRGAEDGCSKYCHVCKKNPITAQTMNMGRPGAKQPKIIARELGHLLGMTHEGYSCIKDEFINGTYESYYYWGGEDLSFRLPSGEKNMPVYVEQRGEYYENESRHEHYLFKNIPWYQKNPPFSDDMFQVPPSMYCKNYTNLHAIPAMPNSFSFSQEELAFTLNDTGFLDGGFSPLSFKQFWYSDNLKLARVDMRPSEEDKKGPILKNATGINGRVTVVMDFNYNHVFLAHSANEECLILDVDKDFLLCSKSNEKCSKINREGLFGVSAELSYKGKESFLQGGPLPLNLK
ncbi:uncharacterized protein ISCGN_002591 [Ixodes scapularis]